MLAVRTEKKSLFLCLLLDERDCVGTLYLTIFLVVLENLTKSSCISLLPVMVCNWVLTYVVGMSLSLSLTHSLTLSLSLLLAVAVVMEEEVGMREAGLFVKELPRFRTSNLHVMENRIRKRNDQVYHTQQSIQWCLTHSLSHTHTLSHTHFLTLTHTHSLSLFLSLTHSQILQVFCLLHELTN